MKITLDAAMRARDVSPPRAGDASTVDASTVDDSTGDGSAGADRKGDGSPVNSNTGDDSTRGRGLDPAARVRARGRP